MGLPPSFFSSGRGGCARRRLSSGRLADHIFRYAFLIVGRTSLIGHLLHHGQLALAERLQTALS